MGLKHPTQLCNQLSHVTPPPPPPRAILVVTRLGRGGGRACWQVCGRLGPCGAGKLTPLTERGRVFQEAAGSTDRPAAGRDPAAPPGPARSAQRDSALTHRARCQWISPSAAPACLSSPPPAPPALSCTPGQSLRFRQSSGADFTAFESRPKQGSDWLCFL